jgi:peptidoglycan/LPS O-acetylase OafA/YrhL
MTQARQPADLRPDIQGLRAVAVSMVVAFHLAPRALTGGYTGVDVFFVISGFLITSHLFNHPPTTARDLGTFWARRIRRLLPASLLVLASTLVAARFVAPETQWEPTARQAAGAALYGVNWLLASDAVDYLAAENAPTAVQHFWSLSVEEQFYAGWPLLIGGLVLLAGLLRRRRASVVAIGLGAVVTLSFIYSVVHTHTSPSSAYFVTPTRIWELGAGGVLALVVAPGVLGERRRLAQPLAGPVAWFGLVLIALTGLTYSSATPFPGYTALLPVLGTVLVIAANAPPSGVSSPARLLAARPVQWLGGVSYSVYLWHWPLVVLVPYATGRPIGLLSGSFVLLATLGLAGVTKRHVEDRFRFPAPGTRLRRPYVFAAAGMACVVAAAALQIIAVRHSEVAAQTKLAHALSSNDPCFGAAALDAGKSCPAVAFDDVLPTPAQAAKDKSAAYAEIGGRNCWAFSPNFPTIRCGFGPRTGTANIALLGNSHAGQWLPALQPLARKHHWHIDTFLASQCAAAAVDQSLDTQAHTQSCRAWGTRTVDRIIARHPDLVVFSNRISVSAVGHDLAGSQAPYRSGYAAVLERFATAGIPVLVLRDTPAPGTSIPDCIASHEGDLTSCDGTREAWLPAEPAIAAVADTGSPLVRILDLTDRICGKTVCSAVVGGVITYFDGSHLTATYAHTLAPYLDTAIASSLAR